MRFPQNRTQTELYMERRREPEDAISAELRAACDEWRNVAGRPAKEARRRTFPPCF